MSPRTTSRRTPPRSSTCATVRWTSNRSSCACRSMAPRRRRPSTIRSPTAETSWTSSPWPTGASSTAPTRRPTTSSSSSSPAASDAEKRATLRTRRRLGSAQRGLDPRPRPPDLLELCLVEPGVLQRGERIAYRDEVERRVVGHDLHRGQPHVALGMTESVQDERERGGLDLLVLGSSAIPEIPEGSQGEYALLVVAGRPVPVPEVLQRRGR